MCDGTNRSEGSVTCAIVIIDRSGRRTAATVTVLR